MEGIVRVTEGKSTESYGGTESFLESKIEKVEQNVLGLTLFYKDMSEKGLFNFIGETKDLLNHYQDALSQLYLAYAMSLFPNDDGSEYAFKAVELNPDIKARKSTKILVDFDIDSSNKRIARTYTEEFALTETSMRLAETILDSVRICLEKEKNNTHSDSI